MLTKEQIDTLYHFCRKHYVNHYDVQVELVDHLANAIEARMAEDKQLSFELALEKVYTGFGRMGFSQLVKSRSDALSAKFRKQRFSFFLSYFTWPKIGLTALVIALILLTGRVLTGEMRFYVVAVMSVMVFIYDMYVGITLIRKVRSQPKAMVITNAVMEEPFIVFLFVFFIVPGVYSDLHDTGFLEYLAMTVLALVVVLFILAYQEVARKVFTLAKRDYPEAFTITQ